MGRQKSFRLLGISAIALGPALVIFACVLPQLPLQSSPKTQISLKFPPTQSLGAPSRTVGGGTRGSSCMQENSMPLTVLMPKNHVETTVTANPTFFWYIPKTNAKSAEFVLVDNDDNEVYSTTFTFSATPGVVQLSLPATASLKIGKDYQWRLSVICNPLDRSNEKYVQGLVRRTNLSPVLKMKLEQATPLEQARMYATAGIWLDTLSIAARLRRSYPAEWEELLKSVGLEAIAQAPFVDCCRAEN